MSVCLFRQMNNFYLFIYLHDKLKQNHYKNEFICSYRGTFRECVVLFSYSFFSPLYQPALIILDGIWKTKNNSLMF